MNNGEVTITQTAPDGTETKIEINRDADPSLVEEVIEAVFDPGTGDAAELDDLGEFTVDEPVTSESDEEIAEVPAAPETVDFATEPVTDAADDAAENAAQAEAVAAEQAAAAETEAHAQAARDAQEAADSFIEQGDYKAAAEAREAAENEAWEAGDQSALHGSTSTELEGAAARQDNAEYYEQQEAWHAQHGEYAAARDDARAAAAETGWADYQAGGSDHSGQAVKEAEQMDWAVWEEGNAAYQEQNAEWFAEHGDFEQAQASADLAAEHQAAADYHGDLGEHGGEFAVNDPSSEVSSGGSYESPEVDTTDYSTSE